MGSRVCLIKSLACWASRFESGRGHQKQLEYCKGSRLIIVQSMKFEPYIGMRTQTLESVHSETYRNILVLWYMDITLGCPPGERGLSPRRIAINSGQVTERLKVLVLNTSEGESPPWVRIPPCPPLNTTGP